MIILIFPLLFHLFIFKITIIFIFPLFFHFLFHLFIFKIMIILIFPLLSHLFIFKITIIFIFPLHFISDCFLSLCLFCFFLFCMRFKMKRKIPLLLETFPTHQTKITIFYFLFFPM